MLKLCQDSQLPAEHSLVRQLSAPFLLVSKKGWGVLFFSFFKVNVHMECFLCLRVGERRKPLSTSSFLSRKWSNSLFKYFQNGYTSEAWVSFPLPTLMKDDTKCNKMGSRDIRLFIPNISANEKANLSSLSWGLCSQTLWQYSWHGHPRSPPSASRAPWNPLSLQVSH